MAKEKKYVLVTGGAGYIGAAACYRLYHAGYVPIAYDNLVTGHRHAVQWGPFIEGDILDAKKLEEVFSSYPIFSVMHFAALALVGESVLFPQKYYLNNVQGTLTLLQAMMHYGVKNIVFSSSCATYGIPNEIPIQEDSLQNPINPYGHSKFMVEQILKDYEKIGKIRYAILRYFNAAGADLEANIGEDHGNETHLIPLAIETALHRYPKFQLMGTDHPTKDGTAIRDYLHITDIARAHNLALQYIENEKKSLILNLGTGQGFSVLEIVREIEKHTKEKLPIEIAPIRKGDPPMLIADITQAKKILKWAPSHSDIHSIISSALTWHTHHLPSFRENKCS